MEQIKIALVGLGRISKTHIEALLSMDLGDNIKLLCDSDQNKLDDLPIFKDVKRTNFYTDVLNSDCNLVIIMTPHHLHQSMSMEALNYGKNVICEKPVAFTSFQVAELYATAAQKKVRFFQVLQNRYNSAVQYVKRVIENGKLGQIRFVSAKCFWARGAEYYAKDKWRGTRGERDRSI